ncbi:hypothetical protein [Streptomyces pratensis]|uniref:hypothetical protein n=1 Tax=Streptomyces pratensis TaxID=1169025 RepID=UPI003017C38F
MILHAGAASDPASHAARRRWAGVRTDRATRLTVFTAAGGPCTVPIDLGDGARRIGLHHAVPLQVDDLRAHLEPGDDPHRPKNCSPAAR